MKRRLPNIFFWSIVSTAFIEPEAVSQGTMNIVLSGNENYGYYETLAGGTGSGSGFHEKDAAHHHMTNIRLTDPEVLEHRYPFRINRFEI